MLLQKRVEDSLMGTAPHFAAFMCHQCLFWKCYALTNTDWWKLKMRKYIITWFYFDGWSFKSRHSLNDKLWSWYLSSWKIKSILQCKIICWTYYDRHFRRCVWLLSQLCCGIVFSSSVRSIPWGIEVKQD